nr:NAD-glutamate dehydrogenase [Gammaproteobacteria bacterium]
NRCPVRSRLEAPILVEIAKQATQKDYKKIETNISRVLHDVMVAVDDWQLMKSKMIDTIKQLEHEALPQSEAEINESKVFLEWLLNNRFTFLGIRDYKVTGSGENCGLRLVKGSGLGVLRDDSRSRHSRLFSDLRPEARQLMLSKEHLLIISKTNTRSSVHRPTHTDYIGVKRYNDQGELIGERRFIGLYTSTAYHSLPSEIPFLRHKVASIIKRSGLPANSHAGKELVNILSNMPRDDLFQATHDELYDISMGILNLQERKRIRLFLREDAYGRYVSCLIYIPRDNFNTAVLRKMEKILLKTLKGSEINYNTYFTASVLACVHFVVRIDSKKRIRYNVDDLEKKLIEVGQSWSDQFKHAVIAHFGDVLGERIFKKYEHAFPPDYCESNSFRQVVYDLSKLESISEESPLEMSVYHNESLGDNVIQFKLFRINHTIPLSDVLPVLENMGLRVMREEPYCVRLKDKVIWINDFTMIYVDGGYEQVKPARNLFEEAFYRIWYAHMENDLFNRLVLDAHLDWRSIVMIRAYTMYLRQVGFTFSTEYVAKTFLHNVAHAKLFIKIFNLYFDPKIKRNDAKIRSLESQYITMLDDVAILDEDRILRRFLDLLHATLRVNFFQKNRKHVYQDYMSIKLDPSKIPDIPLPLPRFEIFVYSPRFEGVHLRAHKVARGGLRWSDRREDFRTEILGLMKAQQVKNSVIVPSGAKGGFVAKRLPVKGSRKEIMDEGIACYKDFIKGLLDITDNLKNDRIRPPSNTVCYDEPDPYLVVAADKGTSTFSDIANSIAIEKEFWLGDAFASGGSKGYDHKKIAITARGAWVSAERQFQELGINVYNTEITVAGVGDMAGDVFGNGMLLSDKLKLVAAFNHVNIFIDPSPDPQKSYEERKRLFKMPRSSWEDYDRKLISRGGGIFKRTAKSIKLTAEIKKLLQTNKDAMVPNELIQAVLRAPVDMIWNGGVGTFVKASSEDSQNVGDRGNDHIRVNGNELQARVVCEGGNLGFTQLGRVEYELSGGKINTDFIDNSAGVDCSDHEVNIKILLNNVVSHGQMNEKKRNQLLVKMTEEVSDLVLQNNYHQNEAISYAAYMSPKKLALFGYYMDYLSEKKLVNIALQFLPDKQVLSDRRAAGLGLTKPELSVLLAYTKIILEERIRKSDLPEDPYLEQYMKEAFPTILRQRYPEQM